ncbi:MAG: transcription elongation factor GreA [Christensenellaceae bacterium]|jgi:transcription elongation factor GreA|nr:transcription elongation factor GreA [Christensenellaceae bacterium]
MEKNGEYEGTIDDRKAMEKELETLKSKRAEIASQIKEAREFGDLRENAEYAAAREAQANNENSIADIEDKLSRFKVSKNVEFLPNGTIVSVENSKTHKIIDYVLKSSFDLKSSVNAESGPRAISNVSPIGRIIFQDDIKVNSVHDVIIPATNTKYKIKIVGIKKAKG